MLIAHRIALDPNHVQATYFARAARARRERGGESQESGGEFHRVSLWRGRRWLPSCDGSETSLGEAGSKQQI